MQGPRVGLGSFIDHPVSLLLIFGYKRLSEMLLVSLVIPMVRVFFLLLIIQVLTLVLIQLLVLLFLFKATCFDLFIIYKEYERFECYLSCLTLSTFKFNYFFFIN